MIADVVWVPASFEFWMLMLCCCPPLNQGCGGKLTGFGLAVSVPVIPVPDSGTSSVPESSVISNDAVCGPALVALNVTWTLHEPVVGRNALGHVLPLSWNSEAFGPTTPRVLTMT